MRRGRGQWWAFELLCQRQSTCRFESSSVPPLVRATMWSTVSGLASDPRVPHTAHTEKGRSTCLRSCCHPYPYPRSVVEPRDASRRRVQERHRAPRPSNSCLQPGHGRGNPLTMHRQKTREGLAGGRRPKNYRTPYRAELLDAMTSAQKSRSPVVPMLPSRDAWLELHERTAPSEQPVAAFEP
jgi:hypothetical protein